MKKKLGMAIRLLIEVATELGREEVERPAKLPESPAKLTLLDGSGVRRGALCKKSSEIPHEIAPRVVVKSTDE